jgi:carbamoyl-phosphate synthase large subunit
MGVLAEYGVEMIGAKREAIEMAEDRKLFREAMERIGLENPKRHHRQRAEAGPASTTSGGPRAGHGGAGGDRPARDHPPAFTLGGTGGGVAYNREDLRALCRTGLEASPVAQILIDENPARLEGIRDGGRPRPRGQRDHRLLHRERRPDGRAHGRLDHRGPALTLTDKEYQMMRDASIAVLREIGVETGGSNVQWA